MEFARTFVVSPLKRCSSGILGMDFLQRVGVEINLIAQLLYIGRRSFPLRGQELEFSEIHRLIKAGLSGPLGLGYLGKEDESVED